MMNNKDRRIRIKFNWCWYSYILWFRLESNERFI